MEVSKKNVCVCKKSYHLTRATSEKNISMFDLSFLHVGSQFFILKQEFYMFLIFCSYKSFFYYPYSCYITSLLRFQTSFSVNTINLIMFSLKTKKTAMNQNIMFNNTVCKTCPKLQFWKLKFCSKYKCNCTTELAAATKLFTLNRSCL